MHPFFTCLFTKGGDSDPSFGMLCVKLTVLYRREYVSVGDMPLVNKKAVFDVSRK